MEAEQRDHSAVHLTAALAPAFYLRPTTVRAAGLSKGRKLEDTPRGPRPFHTALPSPTLSLGA